MLNSVKSLVLNYSYEPLQFCSAKRAIIMVFNERAEFIESDGYVVRTPTTSFKLPAVIRVLNIVKRTKRRSISFSKKNILRRDNFTCQYCYYKFSANELTFDHLIPRCLNGKTTWNNVVSACTSCNLKKGRRLLNHSDMKLEKIPKRPTSAQLQNNGRNFPPNFLHETWRDYLYWDTELEN